MTERLRIENLFKIFSDTPERAQHILAVGGDKNRVFEELGVVVGLNDVSLTIPAGATYVVMGLSGSGKSTLARCINRLNEPTAGKILLDGQDILTLNEAMLRDLRRSSDLYSVDPSDTVSVRWINRVNMDTIRFRLVLPTRLSSGSIASNEMRIS